MLKNILSLCTGCVSMAFVMMNTLVLALPLFVSIFFKLVIPFPQSRAFFSRLIIRITVLWIDNNSLIMHFTQNICWDVRMPPGLDLNQNYLVVSNHCSWADIAILQWIFNHKIPVLRFFIKEELKWVPILGVAFWALDFPFMKRYSKKILAEKPHLRGKDIETTKKACEKFKLAPVAILNFLEGTRFNAEKYHSSQSGFRNLLKPKAGGIAFALNAMDGKITRLLDVTLVYHDDQYGLWDMMCGRMTSVTLVASIKDIPSELLVGDYQEDEQYRADFQAWVNQLWQDKDQLIDLMSSK